VVTQGALSQECANLGLGYRSDFCIAGVSVKITGLQSNDAALVASLEPFQDGPRLSAISLYVDWVTRLLPSTHDRLFDSGTTWRLYGGDGEFVFEFTAPRFGREPYKRLHVDLLFTRGIIQMSRESLLAHDGAISPLEYPLDELLIMHRLTQEKAIELHGCGIVRTDGVGNLFVGHSGAGKSTTTRLWTSSQDVEVLSDTGLSCGGMTDVLPQSG
jgi:hypothetical protein